jgi:hypothetical protein
MSQHCQSTGKLACPTPAAFKITVRWKSGAEFVEAHCRHCVAVREREISAEGGSIVGAEALPEQPSVENLLVPVGLDAITPATVAEGAAR